MQVAVGNNFGDSGVEMIAAALSGTYVDVLYKRANDVSHVTGVKDPENDDRPEEVELKFAEMAEASRRRRLTPQQVMSLTLAVGRWCARAAWSLRAA